MSKEWEEKLASQKYNVEHALAIEALKTIIMPVRFIYEPERLKEFKTALRCCHIYMIGYMPTIQTDGAGIIDKDHVITNWLVGGKPYTVRTSIFAEGCTVHEEGGRWWIVDPKGIRRTPDTLMKRARQQLGDEQTAFPFKVLYIGQAFGKNGSRQALDRLLQGHEKLQEICIKGVPPEHAIYLLFINVAPGPNLNTILNPQAKEQGNTHGRILKGLEAQQETTEAQKTTLFEASFIRYFKPLYNKEFKENFPSTNMNLLQECYEKDINTIIAELNIDAEFQVTSDTIPPQKNHMAIHELHSEMDRKIFFGLIK